MLDRGRHVRAQRGDVALMRTSSREHPKVVLDVAERGVGRDRSLSPRRPEQRGDGRRDGRAESHGIVDRRVVVAVVERPDAVRRPDEGQDRLQAGERVRGARAHRDLAHRGVERARKGPRARGARGERLIRGRACEDELPRRLEGAAVREVQGGHSSIVVEALVTTDVPDRGLGDDDIRETSRDVDESGIGAIDSAHD